jgi:hypothetical protein
MNRLRLAYAVYVSVIAGIAVFMSLAFLSITTFNLHAQDWGWAIPWPITAAVWLFALLCSWTAVNAWKKKSFFGGVLAMGLVLLPVVSWLLFTAVQGLLYGYGTPIETLVYAAVTAMTVVALSGLFFKHVRDALRT